MNTTNTRPIALTGIKATGKPHIGNYLGMIQPALQLVDEYRALYFIADFHALTTLKDPAMLREYTYETAATWLALGLNPDEVVFYRQSDIPEVFELTWILDCFTPKGLLNRAHAYKAAVDANMAAGTNPDDGINAGLFNYPVLMAADILLFDAHVVPVGLDQKQHLEITRDIALAFNNQYGDVLTVPEALIKEEVMTITGLDGRKMSKSYDNTIEIFAPPDELRQRVMKIVTDSRTPADPKNPDECNIFAIYRHFAPPDDVERIRQRYLAGGLAYGVLKQELFELLDAAFGEARERYHHYVNDTRYIDNVLSRGAQIAHEIAAPVLQRVRDSLGVNRILLAASINL